MSRRAYSGPRQAFRTGPLRSDSQGARRWRCICWRRRISRSTRPNCACGALSPATAKIARFRSLPTRSSCAARWCPGVVRLIMDGVQPAKVSDLLSRKSAATNARGRSGSLGACSTVGSGWVSPRKHVTIRPCSQSSDTDTSSSGANDGSSLCSRQASDPAPSGPREVMRQLPLEFGEVA